MVFWKELSYPEGVIATTNNDCQAKKNLNILLKVA